jgi:dihydroorotase
MVHVAEPPVYVEDVVDVLDRGDVITHCFHGKVGNSLRTSRERVVPLYRAAADKGIVLDIGHGAASFSVESARTAFAAGIAPHTISTDLHRGNVDTCVRSLALTMSKMLALGMNLEDVVSAVSKTPAGVLVEPGYGELVIGARARFTVFTLESGSYQFLDTPAPDDSTPGTEPGIRKEYSGDALIQPLYTVWGTSVKPCRTINLEDV